MTEEEILRNQVPEAIQALIASGHTDKVATIVTGLESFDLPKIAEYLGTRMALRKQQRRIINDGLTALDHLLHR